MSSVSLKWTAILLKIMCIFVLFARQSVKDVLTMCKMGVITPNISETLKLDQVNEALEHFSTDKSSGKILLKVAD